MNPPEIKLRSLKDVQKDKLAPAGNFRSSVSYFDWGEEQIVPNTKRQGKLIGYKGLKQEDIPGMLDSIGMYTDTNMISLPCKEVMDIYGVVKPGSTINQSLGVQLLNPKPLTGLDKLAFVPEDRLGKYGADLLQRPFVFSSFGSACP